MPCKAIHGKEVIEPDTECVMCCHVLLCVLLCEDVNYLNEKDRQNHDESAGAMEKGFPFACVFSECVFHVFLCVVCWEINLSRLRRPFSYLCRGQ